MKDMFGYEFSIGAKVARAVMWGKSPRIELCTVTRIDGGKLYLDDSKQPMKHPERLLILEQDKLFRAIQDYERTNSNTD